MNYYEHHLGDYDSATAHLSWDEDAAYRRLICLYYRTEAPITADLKQACRLLRATTKQEREAVQQVLSEFFTLADDGWHNARCDADISRYQAKAERNREVGKLGGRPRKVETQTEPTKNPDGSFWEPKQNPPQTPDTRHQTPIPPLPPSGGKRATRLPADWMLPKSWGEWAMSEQPSWTAEHCRKAAASFADYWQAKPGKNATKLDWEKTWHGWVRREGPMRVQGAGFQQPNGHASPSASPEIAKTRALLESQQLSPEQIEDNRARAAEIRAQLKAVG